MNDFKYFKLNILSVLLLTFLVCSVNGQNAPKFSSAYQCKHEVCCKKNTGKIPQQSNYKGSSGLGTIQASTNPALPAEYNFQEYVFPEPNDQGTCQGIQNNTAVIDEIFLSQTHRHAIGHPFLFTIAERPALLQLAVTGSGPSPDVEVEGILNGVSLGTLCLNGPVNLSATINLNLPNFSDYFSVTLPKAWIKEGLELSITAGNDSRMLMPNDLQITPYTELNLVLVNIDVLDFNFEPHRTPIFNDFLQELASAIPASVIRFGVFPETLKLPTLATNNNVGAVVFLETGEFNVVDVNGLDYGYLNGVAHSMLGSMQEATGDFPNTIYFGNTLNLDPGGWGVDGNFVSYEYTDIFIHELGHALSLPHWEDEFQLANPNPDQFSYPYAGESGFGGGRGEAWNFIQDTYEFVNPMCEDTSSTLGFERSDAMQREHACIETRPSGLGPWDGFGDFSMKAISNYLLGSVPQTGQVSYKGTLEDYQFKENPGYPLVTLVNGQRSFTRAPSQPQNTYAEDIIKLPGMEAVEQDVYLIYGSAHAFDTSASIIYDPISYKGILLPTIDPTDPTMFSTLQNLQYADAPSLYDETRDITLKLLYDDGSESHAIVPFHSYERSETNNPNDTLELTYFSLVVPGNKALCGVELYRRDFIVSDPGNTIPGNINDPLQNITAANFMNNAILMATLDYACNCPGSPGHIPSGTPCDDGNPFTTDDVEDGFCTCAGIPIASCGQIRNSEFKESLVSWWHWGSNASSTNEEATFENIDDTNAGIATNQLDFNMNEHYAVRFDAYSSAPRAIDVVLFDENEVVLYQETVNLTTTKQFYELFYMHTTNALANANIEFNFVGNTPDVFLDNICLDTCGLVEIPNNGIDDDCDPLTLDNVTSVDVLLEPLAITLFPNPTAGIFEIVGPNDNYIIRIIDSNGVLVQTINYSGASHNIDISQLPAGILFIEITNQQNTTICLKKIIKD